MEKESSKFISSIFERKQLNYEIYQVYEILHLKYITKATKSYAQTMCLTFNVYQMLRKQNSKDEKQSESLPNYFLGIFWEKKGILSIQDTF